MDRTASEIKSSNDEAQKPKKKRSWLKRILLGLLILAALLLLAAAGLGIWAYSRLQGSLPQLEGELAVQGLSAPAEVERDSLGIPVIRGQSRRDVALATGFVHAQDRLFQMDLLRRRAAGELSGLFGARAFPADRRIRVHRLRSIAEQRLATLEGRQREILQAYAQGVNQGMAAADAPPFEYLLLQTDPQPWKPEDSLLVVLAMFMELQDDEGDGEATLGLMHDLLPASLYEFLTPRGTEWDAPVEGEPFLTPPLPDPQDVDLRQAQSRSAPKPPPLPEPDMRAMLKPGSNNWAVSGEHTADGKPLVANDMHLSLGVPNIWYRASLAWTDPQGEERRVTGVTLPGAPLMVIGSNGSVAWGYTDGQADTNDIILLEINPQDEQSYLTPDGYRPFERHREVLRASGGEEEEIEVAWTIWGPVRQPDAQGRPRAFRWVAYLPESLNLDALDLETARSTAEALGVANRMGVPALNFVAADSQGHIGWTIAGRVPRRVGFDGRLPTSWADGSRRWDGLLAPEEIPRILDPKIGRIWTANNRVIGGQGYELLGDDGYILGARARQIRDDLLQIEKATPQDMLKIQLDSRALLLERWHGLLLEILTPQAVQADPKLQEVRQLVEDWGGCACVDSVGYRIVRGFRIFLAQQVIGSLTAKCAEADPAFNYMNQVDQWEGPLWKLVTQRPLHLLDQRYDSWEGFMLATLNQVLEAMQRDGRPLAEKTWGEVNTTAIAHPLSSALPGAGGWLDMPARRLDGDSNMPHVQRSSFGASQRMAVSPGQEEKGIFHMPGGQSGHPLSPHYRDSHQAWAEGQPTPFLPGPPVHVLKLLPHG